jgi:hypothetical protein
MSNLIEQAIDKPPKSCKQAHGCRDEKSSRRQFLRTNIGDELANKSLDRGRALPVVFEIRPQRREGVVNRRTSSRRRLATGTLRRQHFARLKF